jgi:hypothetical protein
MDWIVSRYRPAHYAFSFFHLDIETSTKADKSAMGAINRPLLVSALICQCALLASTDDRMSVLKSIICAEFGLIEEARGV